MSLVVLEIPEGIKILFIRSPVNKLCGTFSRRSVEGQIRLFLRLNWRKDSTYLSGAPGNFVVHTKSTVMLYRRGPAFPEVPGDQIMGKRNLGKLLEGG